MLAISQDVYDALKYIHILAAIVWVGGGGGRHAAEQPAGERRDFVDSA